MKKNFKQKLLKDPKLERIITKLKKHKIKLRVLKDPTSWTFHACFYWRTREICIWYANNSNYADMVVALVHETTHLFQQTEGMFKSYFDHFIVAVAAERHADKVALGFVLDHYPNFKVSDVRFRYLSKYPSVYQRLRSKYN